MTLRIAPEDDVAEAKTLGEAVVILRKRAGSHDRFAKELGTSRQRVIDWEQGGFPRNYIEKLRARGVPPHLLTEEGARKAERARVAELAEEVAELRSELDEARLGQSGLLQRVEALERAASIPTGSGRRARAKPRGEG